MADILVRSPCNSNIDSRLQDFNAGSALGYFGRLLPFILFYRRELQETLVLPASAS
jgi:hypothetical protein